jgi:molybdate transport system ATP-binding protein
MRLMTEQILLVEKGQVVQEMTTEELARSDRVASQQGYNNLIRLGRARPHGDLWSYRWGDCSLVLTSQGDKDENIFALDARDILLCKHHPGGTSVRNLLLCTVRNILTIGHQVQVELQCGTNQLFAQIVPESIGELEISPGTQVVAMIKASAFRPLL